MALRPRTTAQIGRVSDVHRPYQSIRLDLIRTGGTLKMCFWQLHLVKMFNLYHQKGNVGTSRYRTQLVCHLETTACLTLSCHVCPF